MKKRKRRRKVWKIVLAVLAAVILLAVIAVFGFRKRSVEVEGNEYYSANSITAWIENDELSVNSLYLLLKYNFTEAELPSAVESMEVSLKNPWTVHVTVKEKDMLGYVDYDGACLYFDKDGIASLRTKELLEGVPHIEGLVFDASKVVIGSRLPVEDSSIFEKIICLSARTNDNINPDKCIGHTFFYMCHFFSKKLCRIPAVHQFQYFVASALQRNMEVGHKSARLGTIINDLICK